MNLNPIETLREGYDSVSQSLDKYYILNKSNPICEFKWIGGYDTDSITKVTSVNILSSNVPTFISSDVEGWLDSRTPPKHREFMEELMKEIGLKSTRMIVDYSKGLSLTDTFWVTNDLSIKWDDVTLFDNEFDEVISKVAFEGGLVGRNIKTTSPEFGTGGMLPKCWVRDKSTSTISLKKGGTSGYRNTGNEPYSEVLASQILDVLGYSHVQYTLEKFRGKVVSSCDLITSKEVMMIPIYMMCSITSLSKIISYCEEAGIANSLYEILIFDYLTNNSDRHGNNFAVLLDSDTLELKSMAPIYDNGCSCLCYYTVGDDLDDYLKRCIPSLYDFYLAAAKEAKRNLSTPHNVQSLLNFKFDRSKLMDYNEEKITIVEKLVQQRARKFMALE